MQWHVVYSLYIEHFALKNSVTQIFNDHQPFLYKLMGTSDLLHMHIAQQAQQPVHPVHQPAQLGGAGRQLERGGNGNWLI